jgi:flagellar hook-basal body complex protein FliE
MAITSIGSSNPIAIPGAATRGAATEGGDFGAALSKLLESVESSATDANSAVAAMADGSGDVHTAMLALQKAEVSMQLTVQVRNKLVQAYQELMRTPI